MANLKESGMFIKDWNKTALVEQDQQISYREMLSFASYYASAYAKNKKQAKVAIFAENRKEYFFAALSAIKMNFIVIPIDALSTADETAYIIKDSQPDYLWHSNETEKTVLEAKKKSRSKAKFLNMDRMEESAASFSADEIEGPSPDDVMLLIYTSGTTGNPKGVMLTQDNVMANIESVSQDDRKFYTEDMRIMVLLPLHHALPFVGTFLVPLYVGGSCAFCPSLTAEDILATLQRDGVTTMIGVPRLYTMIRNGILKKINEKAVTRAVFKLAGGVGSKKLSRVLFKAVHERFGKNMRHLISGGAALDPLVVKDLLTLGLEVYEGYGMTETAPMIACPVTGRVVPGAVGLPIKNTEVKLIDGEVCCRGRNVMKGYYNKPEETKEIIRDGWLHTGDTGKLDKNGYLYITGRIKEIIVLPNGKNINPVEIESKIEDNTQNIAEAAVFEKEGALCSIVRPSDALIKGKTIDEIKQYIKDEVIAPMNEKVSSYKKISKLFITMKELPRTRLEKLRRFKLPDLAHDDTEKAKPEKSKAPKDKEFIQIEDFILQETGKTATPDDHLEIDLGLDSLDKTSLITFVNSTFGTKLSDDLLKENMSIPKLLEYIKVNRNRANVQKFDATHYFKNLLSPAEKEEEKETLHRSRFPHMTIRNIMVFYLRRVCKIKGVGLENLPAAPFIFAANHQSALDWVALAAAIKTKTLRKTYVLAKAKHFEAGWRKWISKRTNILIIDVEKDFDHSIQQMANVLKNGCNLAIFPEGTRSTTGELKTFKKTFSIVAKELNVPVVPVVINGALKVLPPSSKFIRLFQKITVEFLLPQYPGKLSYNELADKVQQAIAEKIEM